MGYLNNQVVEVDAILTKRGRELLSRGAQYFNITQFALADDEIDYRLWNPNHSLGSNYYGEIIEQMPILEAVPDEQQMMKSKLVTLPKTTRKIPVISVALSGNQTLRTGEILTITPNTTNFVLGNGTFGYTCIVSDGSAINLAVGPSGQLSQANAPTTPIYLGDGTNSSVSVMGMNFALTARSIPVDKQVTVTVIGNETGGRSTFTITVKKADLVIGVSGQELLANTFNAQ